MTTIVCQQVAPRIADLQANRRLSLSAIADAVGAGADVVVLPELVTSGYMFQSAEEAASVAITPEDPLFEQWAAEAGGGGRHRRLCRARRGRADLQQRRGRRQLRGDRRVPQGPPVGPREALVRARRGAAPGDSTRRPGGSACSSATTWSSPRCRVRWRWAARSSSACPPTGPGGPPRGERAPEVTIAMAAARVNRVFIACCDRTGTERGQHWNAGTSIVDEQGWVLAAQTGAGPASATVDLARSHDKTYTDWPMRWPTGGPSSTEPWASRCARPVA